MHGPREIYAVKECYLTVQGEGAHTGRPAVFLRFAGCNLWTGREEDRATAICQFCDTDFFRTNGERGSKYASAAAVADVVESLWPAGEARHRYVVCTGGEPMLQLDEALVDELHARRFVVAVETNGTLEVPWSVDWICVSPKIGAPLVQRHGDELKLVYPQEGGDPAQYAGLDFRRFSLQPMDGPRLQARTSIAPSRAVSSLGSNS